MDIDTRQELERISARVPRYLFRVWNCNPYSLHRLSGGYPGLNTLDVITPLAFLRGCGHASVSDLTREEFIKNAVSHLRSEKALAQTEFSSWAASLAFAIHYFGYQLGAACSGGVCAHNVYVSIIDTSDFRKRNAVFHVPDLTFLDPKCNQWDHEYLVHGIVTGVSHRAVSFRVFRNAGLLSHIEFTPKIRYPIIVDNNDTIYQITATSIQRARQIGETYGNKFAFPMALAVLCRVKRDPQLFRNGIKELQMILDGLRGLYNSTECGDDRMAYGGANFVSGYGDVEQFHRLLQVISDVYASEIRYERRQAR